jgi:F-type H+-transporting ATPase subunit c
MREKLMWMFLVLALVCIASPMFAQAPAAGGAEDTNTPAANRHWVAVTAGFAMAIASGLCGLAQAKAVAASAEGMARNPGAAAAIRFALLLGLVLIESLALYTLVIIFAKVK